MLTPLEFQYDVRMSGKLLLIYICNFHVLSNLLLIFICKLHWNLKGVVVEIPLSEMSQFQEDADIEIQQRHEYKERQMDIRTQSILKDEQSTSADMYVFR